MKRGQEYIYDNDNMKGGLLNTLTPARATATLLSVADQHDARAVIRSIRHSAGSAAEQTGLVSGLIDRPWSLTHELSARRPFTYPSGQEIASADRKSTRLNSSHG